jgi:mannose-6-phosphate isomerase-like protein (cupin superfamily)
MSDSPRFDPRRHVAVQGALARLARSGSRFAEAFRHGTLEVEIFTPSDRDVQSPHSRDELYVVLQGSGVFVNGPDRHRFGPGDLLFAAAGEVHRFDEFSDDFAAWVFFYGPEGGEKPR